MPPTRETPSPLFRRRQRLPASPRFAPGECFAVGALLLLVWMLLPARGLAVEASPPLSPEEVRTLVDRLSSPRRADRQEAERRLLDAGPAILPHLPIPAATADPAARETLRRLRTALERRLAEESLTPARVTWSGQATPVELAAIITAQTSNVVEIAAADDSHESPPLTVDWQQTTFWDAVGELMTRGRFGMVPPPAREVDTPASLPRRVRLAPLGGVVDGQAVQTVAGAAASGVFRWEVVHLERRIPASGEETPLLLRVQYRLRAEPRLRPLFVDYREAELRIAADGRWLAPFNPQASRQPDFSREGTVEFSVDYLAEDLSASVPLRVLAQCAVEFAAAPQEIVFRPLHDRLPIVRRAGNVVASLDRLGELPPAESAGPTSSSSGDGRRAFVRLTLRYDAGGPVFESHRIAMVHREVSLVLPGGARRSVNDGQEMTLEQDGAIGAWYRFRGLPADWRDGELICEAPTALLRRSTAVEIDVTAPSWGAAAVPP